MRDSASPSALPDTLAARLAALRTAAAPALLPGPTRDSSDELAARLARLHTPSKRDVERRVPIETKGVELAADKTRDDEVERFLREVEAEQTTANAAGVDDDADKLIRSILSSSSAPSDSSFPLPPCLQRAPRIPSPPASPPLARARQSIPALSPSLLDTLSGVEVQFFRPALAGTTAVPDGHDYGYEDEEHELLRRAGDEAKLEARLLHGDDDGAGAWEARLAGLRQSSPWHCFSPSPSHDTLPRYYIPHHAQQPPRRHPYGTAELPPLQTSTARRKPRTAAELRGRIGSPTSFKHVAHGGAAGRRSVDVQVRAASTVAGPMSRQPARPASPGRG
ncbi:hypothetical protein JCM3770_003621 [Rhodotorula araucariae]